MRFIHADDLRDWVFVYGCGGCSIRTMPDLSGRGIHVTLMEGDVSVTQLFRREDVDQDRHTSMHNLELLVQKLCKEFKQAAHLRNEAANGFGFTGVGS